MEGMSEPEQNGGDIFTPGDVRAEQCEESIQPRGWGGGWPSMGSHSRNSCKGSSQPRMKGMGVGTRGGCPCGGMAWREVSG